MRECYGLYASCQRNHRIMLILIIVNELNLCRFNSFTIIDAHGRTKEVSRFASCARREETNQNASNLIVSYKMERKKGFCYAMHKMWS